MMTLTKTEATLNHSSPTNTLTHPHSLTLMNSSHFPPSTDAMDRKKRQDSMNTAVFVCPVERCTPLDCWIYTVNDDVWTIVHSAYVRFENNKRFPGSTVVTVTDVDSEKESPYWCVLTKDVMRVSRTKNFGVDICRPVPDYPQGSIFNCSMRLTKSITSNEYKKAHPNEAISIVREFAAKMNYSNCWICQNIPLSTSAPIFYPIPLTQAEWAHYNWQGLATHIFSTPGQSTACHFHVGMDRLGNSFTGIKETILNKLILEVNANYKPNNFSRLVLFKVTHFSEIAGPKLVHNIQAILVQVDKHELSTRLACTGVSTTIPWRNSINFSGLKCQIVDCIVRAQTKLHPVKPELQNQIGQFKVVPLKQVTGCIDIFRYNTQIRTQINDLGTSSCIAPIYEMLYPGSELALPGGVFLVCGDTAYSSLKINSVGRCYLAHLIPMIRKVDHAEMQVIYQQSHSRHRRAISTTQAIFGILFPNYGLYNTQIELKALSTVLQSHMNASDRVISALGKELNEMKKVVLQNRFALDIILAGKGGTCAIVGSECCSFISDANDTLTEFHETNKRGIEILNTVHGWNFWGIFDNAFSSPGNILKFLCIVFLVIICIIIIIGVILKCIGKCVNTVTEMPIAALMFKEHIDVRSVRDLREVCAIDLEYLNDFKP